jgi:uncharacterized membrane protein
MPEPGTVYSSTQRRAVLLALGSAGIIASVICWVLLAPDLEPAGLLLLAAASAVATVGGALYGRTLRERIRQAQRASDSERAPAQGGLGALAGGASVVLGAVVPTAGMQGLIAAGGLWAGTALFLMASGVGES